MMEPRLLVLDEPSFGLAPRVVEDIFKIVERIKKEERVSVLLVEQNANLALELADHAYLLETGYVVASGTPKRSQTIRRFAALISATDGAHDARAVAAGVLGFGRRLDLRERRAGAGDDLPLD